MQFLLLKQIQKIKFQPAPWIPASLKLAASFHVPVSSDLLRHLQRHVLKKAAGLRHQCPVCLLPLYPSDSSRKSCEARGQREGDVPQGRWVLCRGAALGGVQG